MAVKTKTKLAWVLSPGFLRGWLQFGVMDRLYKMGLEPDLVVGTSIGSYVGIVPASRTSIEYVQEAHKEYDLKAVMDRGFYNHGLYSSTHSITLLKKYFSKYKTFEDLPVPFYVCTTDKHTLKSRVFSSGDLYGPIQASTALPVFFPPVLIDDREYIDGGLSNPAPLDVAINNGATHTIFIDTYSETFNRENFKTRELNVLAKTLLRSLPNSERRGIGKLYTAVKALLVGKNILSEIPSYILCLQNHLIEKSLQLNPPDIHINLDKVMGDIKIPVSIDSFKNGDDIINKGRNAVDYYLPELEKLKKELGR
jgi:NTE family protein